MTLPNLPLVHVPGGTVILRDARTGISREAVLVDFELGATPVTWSSYLSVSGGDGLGVGQLDSPVHSVSWWDAVRWCNRASEAYGLPLVYAVADFNVTWEVSASGFRLPTEAEWEHACRAGTTGPHYGNLAAVAWTHSDEVEHAQPVACKQANNLGLYDMLGNVWEWCWDYLDPARYADYRVLRGGGWADKHWSVRASVRRGSMPGARLDDLGFRVARGAVGVDQAGQGWSTHADNARANVTKPFPSGWIPLRQALPTGQPRQEN